MIPKLETNLSYDSLHAYRFSTGMEDITLITDADEDEATALWNKFQAMSIQEREQYDSLRHFFEENLHLAIDAQTGKDFGPL